MLAAAGALSFVFEEGVLTQCRASWGCASCPQYPPPVDAADIRSLPEVLQTISEWRVVLETAVAFTIERFYQAQTGGSLSSRDAPFLHSAALPSPAESPAASPHVHNATVVTVADSVSSSATPGLQEEGEASPAELDNTEPVTAPSHLDPLATGFADVTALSQTLQDLSSLLFLPLELPASHRLRVSLGALAMPAPDWLSSERPYSWETGRPMDCMAACAGNEATWFFGPLLWLHP